MSNHVAVLTALNARFPSVKETGLRGLAKKPVMVLARGSSTSAFQAPLVAGAWSDSLVWTPARSDFTTDTELLGNDVEQSAGRLRTLHGGQRGRKLPDHGHRRHRRNADVCDRHGLWLHIDACHGGNLLFSRQMRDRLDGIAMAESVSLDPHKGLLSATRAAMCFSAKALPCNTSAAIPTSSATGLP